MKNHSTAQVEQKAVSSLCRILRACWNLRARAGLASARATSAMLAGGTMTGEGWLQGVLLHELKMGEGTSGDPGRQVVC